MAVKEQKTSKSEFIEKVIMTYFTYHKKDEVKLSFRRRVQKSKRLNVIFNDEKIVALITRYSKKYTLSKSKLIEFILGKYFEENNINITPNPNLDDEIKKYFESDITQQTIRHRYKNGEKTRLLSDLIFQHGTVNLDIQSDSLSLADLNKAYNKEIKFRLISNQELNNENIDTEGLCYVVLVKNALLIKRGLIYRKIQKDSFIHDENNLNNKKVQIVPSTKKNKYIYSFQIDYVILKIAKIIRRKTNDSHQLSIIPFDKKAVLERSSKFIDIASIEYVSRNKQKNYQTKPNYWRLLPQIIGDRSCYYIKLLDKPKTVNQMLKKEHIYKIDKQFLISQLPLAKDINFPESKVSIANILPVYEYKKVPRLKKYILINSEKSK